MSTRKVKFFSDGLALSGVVHLPDDYVEGEVRAGVMVCHGRLAIKEWVPSKWIPYFLEAGYVCFSFDYRNLGESEGNLGKIVPQDEVRDVHHAATFFQQQPEVDAERVGILGWGLGGAVVVAAAAEDDRLKAVVCASGIADGERYGRDGMVHQDWLRRKKAIAEDQVRRVLTGVSEPVEMGLSGKKPRPTEDRGSRYGWYESLATVVGEERASDPEKLGIPTSLTLESLESLYAFKPTDVVHQISPRPLLVIHAVDDSAFPYDHMVDMFERAGEPKTLIGIPQSEHLQWIDPDYPEQAEYVPKVVDWMAEHLGDPVIG